MLLVEGKSAEEVRTSAEAALQVIANWGVKVKLTFSPSKTQAISFTLASKSVEVQMSGKPVDFHPHIKLLGLILDCNLNFIEHSKYIVKKVSKVFNRLSLFVRPTWGLHPENIEVLYHHVIEPIVTYAAGVWGAAVERESVRRRLRTLHRSFAIKATRGFRTLSDIAAGALAQFMPLHLKVREVHRIEQVKKSKSFEELPDDVQMESRVRPQDLLHPSERISISPTFAETQEDADFHRSPINIYTDGSKLESDDVGSAFVIHHESGRHETRKFRLDRTGTVFQAEVYAIDRALQWILKSAKSNVTIFSDSLSALQAMQNRSNVHPLVASIHKSLHAITTEGRLEVRLVWVRAHVGIAGNEEADIAAKSAAMQKRAKVYTDFPISYAKRMIRKEVRDLWQQEYESADTGSFTRSLFPSLDSIARFRTQVGTSFELTQVLTGHGFNKSYLHRFKCSDSDLCPCGLGVQDFHHLLLDCPRFMAKRSDFVGLCDEQDIRPLDMDSMIAHMDIIDSFISLALDVVRTLKSFNLS